MEQSHRSKLPSNARVALRTFEQENPTYLNGTTYAMRGHATQHGARWGRTRQRWYVLGEVPEMLADLVKPVADAGSEANPPDQALGRLGAAIVSRNGLNKSF
jgi:hypothetical protein